MKDFEKNKLISKNIMLLLDRYGFTVNDLARKTGITRQTISHYINEHNFPKSENLLKIAKVFDIEPLELISANPASVYEEDTFLECFRAMRKTNKKGTLVILNPNTYRGFNLETGKKIIIKIVDEEWKDD